MRRMTTMGSSVLGLLNGWRPVSSTYVSTPKPHLRGAMAEARLPGARAEGWAAEAESAAMQARATAGSFHRARASNLGRRRGPAWGCCFKAPVGVPTLTSPQSGCTRARARSLAPRSQGCRRTCRCDAQRCPAPGRQGGTGEPPTCARGAGEEDPNGRACRPALMHVAGQSLSMVPNVLESGCSVQPSPLLLHPQAEQRSSNPSSPLQTQSPPA